MHSFFYLSFCVLNVVSFILLIYYFFKCTSLINKRIGIIPAIIFFFGALSLLSSSLPSETSKKSNDITLNHFSDKAGIPDFKNIIIDDKEFARLSIDVQYQEFPYAQNVPLSIGTSFTGLAAGVKWNQRIIDITPIKNNLFQYYVSGEYKWSFLGINIYTQSKRFEGKIVLD
ncbi:hypothetical protein [Sphingobacterium sp. SGL-16]|uniref:hypothetical protein n=1 Tax=Sphingobacterium sp. SGL-16 TaxID=2710883 RepID=UPI0013EBE9C8|nr:hypothetical protein [Sphingobacterium sp. SGL-16]NGM73749.1 hypothetical protein [Sphingobacterium sp. SGL-16]